ncbi:MAG: hypothetical protein MUF25_23290 [Pirellulaceae bacterium]|nr:hypothetical protein [Pirellulaceae bacterium]
MAALIEQVFIAPKTTPWFRELVENVCKLYGYTWTVRQSSLDADPIY